MRTLGQGAVVGLRMFVPSKLPGVPLLLVLGAPLSSGTPDVRPVGPSLLRAVSCIGPAEAHGSHGHGRARGTCVSSPRARPAHGRAAGAAESRARLTSGLLMVKPLAA